MKKAWIKIIIFVLVVGLAGAFYVFDFRHYLQLEQLGQQQAALQNYTVQHPWLAMIFFFVAVFLLSALSLPGVAFLLLLAGLIFFNFWITLLVASFADALGSTAAFLLSRYLFAQSIRAKYPQQLAVINRGIEKDGGFYLFSLRLMIFFPCFMINLVMGLTSLRILTFYWVTQVGKLPYKSMFTYTGSRLGHLHSPAELFSPQMIAGLTIAGLIPLISRKGIQWLNLQRLKKSRNSL